MSSIDDKARLDWLEKHPEIEISKCWDEEDQWLVHRVRGGRNDREWALLAHHDELRGAIDRAMLIRERTERVMAKDGRTP